MNWTASEERQMRTRKGNHEPRRESLQASLRRDKESGFTTHAARMMAQPLGGVPAECTLVGHCRTFVFAFPRSELLADEIPNHHVVHDRDGMRVAIASDLQEYFESEEAGSLQYEISVAFRAAIRNLHESSTERRQKRDRELFLVIDEFSKFAPITMSSDQCFSIDEVRNGEAVIVGGRQGKRALLVFPALGCPWPEFSPDMFKVNVVLAAVKAVQNVTGYVEKLDESSCFVNSERQAVYTLRMSASASLESVSRITAKELQERSKRINVMLQNMMSETSPETAEVIDSIVLEKSTDDGYLRLSYLRLWQALEDARKHLDHPGLLNERSVIAGDRSPAELKSYRNAVAHWHTGRVDNSYLSDLQLTTMELLRRKYGGETGNGR